MILLGDYLARNTVILIPKEGLKVPDPRTGDALPVEGKRVELNTYWSRRIADGSVKILTKDCNLKGGTTK